MSDRPDIVDELREIASSAYKADDDNSRLGSTTTPQQSRPG